MSEKKKLKQDQLEKVSGGEANTNGLRYCSTCQKEVEFGPGDDCNYYCKICGTYLGPMGD